jgi:outer membrane biosynthesis protein TonB
MVDNPRRQVKARILKTILTPTAQQSTFASRLRPGSVIALSYGEALALEKQGMVKIESFAATTRNATVDPVEETKAVDPVEETKAVDPVEEVKESKPKTKRKRKSKKAE